MRATINKSKAMRIREDSDENEGIINSCDTRKEVVTTYKQLEMNVLNDG